MKFKVIEERELKALTHSGYFEVFIELITDGMGRVEAYRTIEDMRRKNGARRRYSCYQSFLGGYRKWIKAAK